ncbi:SAF domain-containing protein [Arthrobacter sp. FW305-123]|nr:SAF domain-containing protein [Arthrobacter sp. FW305-123]
MPHMSRSALLARAERSSRAASHWPQLSPGPSLPAHSRVRTGLRSRRSGSGAGPGLRGQRPGFGFWILRNRRFAVALLLCVAAGIAVQQLTPASEQRITILVAARDLPTGTSLAATDFTSIEVPPGLAISEAPGNVNGLVGRQLASPLGQGQIPSESSLLGPGLLTGAPVGSAAVPLRMADPSSIQLLSPGQLITVVLTAAGSYDESRQSQILAGPLPVLWTSAQGGKPGEWLGTGDTEGLVVVAADPQQAEKLAGASTQGKLFFVLVSP